MSTFERGARTGRHTRSARTSCIWLTSFPRATLLSAWATLRLEMSSLKRVKRLA